ncbi:hypothetical protein [Sphingobium sp.]|uniref:hypothetical protein n=1 Tax=Sphingobium sp. TaxID=1912891 RepID=UPI0035C674ED
MTVQIEQFGAWLIGQHSRPGWIGDLARVAAGDRTFPRSGDPDRVRGYLDRTHAEADMFEALEDAEALWFGFSRY